MSEYLIRFNPSVGILSVQTPAPRLEMSTSSQFQSLGRDSERSNHTSARPALAALPVSIPRSGF